jgi:hypothetical protein
VPKLDSNVETDFDRALYVVVSRAGSGSLAQRITRLDWKIAVLAVRRIAPSFSYLKIHDLNAASLPEQNRFLFINPFYWSRFLHGLCLFQNYALHAKSTCL